MISENLKYLRITSKLSQEEFGKQFGLTRQQIGRLEKGDIHWLSATTLAEIAEKYIIAIDDLVKTSLAKKATVPEKSMEVDSSIEVASMFERLLKECETKMQLVVNEKDERIKRMSEEVEYLKDRIIAQETLFKEMQKNR